MCDDLTAHEEDLALAASGLNRREFAALGAAGVLAAYAGSVRQRPLAGKLTKASVEVPTPDGKADALFVRPGQGQASRGNHVARRCRAFAMPTRKWAGGWPRRVLQCWWSTTITARARLPLLATMAEWRSPAGQEKLKPAIASLSADNDSQAMRQAFAQWLDTQPSVNRKRGIGTQRLLPDRILRDPQRGGAAAADRGCGFVPRRRAGDRQAGQPAYIVRQEPGELPDRDRPQR